MEEYKKLHGALSLVKVDKEEMKKFVKHMAKKMEKEGGYLIHTGVDRGGMAVGLGACLVRSRKE